MDRSEKAIFTNMCMVYDDNGSLRNGADVPAVPEGRGK